jgi:hypothetical protein
MCEIVFILPWDAVQDVNVEHKIFDLRMTFQREFSCISNAGQVVGAVLHIYK